MKVDKCYSCKGKVVATEFFVSDHEGVNLVCSSCYIRIQEEKAYSRGFHDGQESQEGKMVEMGERRYSQGKRQAFVDMLRIMGKDISAELTVSDSQLWTTIRTTLREQKNSIKSLRRTLLEIETKSKQTTLPF
jgi:hypothetical protein